MITVAFNVLWRGVGCSVLRGISTSMLPAVCREVTFSPTYPLVKVIFIFFQHCAKTIRKSIVLMNIVTYLRRVAENHIDTNAMLDRKKVLDAGQRCEIYGRTEEHTLKHIATLPSFPKTTYLQASI